jgi:hypothetical protein
MRVALPPPARGQPAPVSLSSPRPGGRRGLGPPPRPAEGGMADRRVRGDRGERPAGLVAGSKVTRALAPKSLTHTVSRSSTTPRRAAGPRRTASTPSTAGSPGRSERACRRTTRSFTRPVESLRIPLPAAEELIAIVHGAVRQAALRRGEAGPRPDPRSPTGRGPGSPRAARSCGPPPIAGWGNHESPGAPPADPGTDLDASVPSSGAGPRCRSTRTAPEPDRRAG